MESEIVVWGVKVDSDVFKVIIVESNVLVLSKAANMFNKIYIEHLQVSIQQREGIKHVKQVKRVFD